jgi:magnesium-protoporphyrin O-methyltransferase
VRCSCCAGEALDIFSEKGARRELRRYLENGLGGADAKLIAEWAEADGLEGKSVVEVGGGIGQIQTELLRRGAARGRVVEVVPQYELPAGELARAAGVSARTSFVLTDLLGAPDSVEPGDVVILRRVVCCTPNGPELLGAAAAKSRRMLLASYPRDRMITRAFSRLENLCFRLVRKRFRSYVHPPAELERAVARGGLTRSRVARGLVWETARYDAPALTKS